MGWAQVSIIRAGGVLNANDLLVGATSHPTSHCMRLMITSSHVLVSAFVIVFGAFFLLSFSLRAGPSFET